MDLILNGQATGRVASTLLSTGFNISALRPYVGKDGRAYVTSNVNGKLQAVPVRNDAATLRRDEWKQIDDAVVVAAKERLRLIADLRGRGLTYNIPNAMGKTVLESAVVGDITPATISMDPARQSEGDRPQFDILNLPLPVIHKDFYFTARQIAVSRNGGGALDTTMIQLAGRRVAEEAEKLALGTGPIVTYGGGSVYGLLNYPNRITSVDLTEPTSSSWTPSVFVSEVLAMRAASEAAFYHGPWLLYLGPAWDQYLDEDYSATKGDNTLRERLARINGIQSIQTLDFLTGFDVILVQATTDVIRLVMGMDITTVQWESLGGMRLDFKVMAIMVPQIRADINNRTGLVHAAVP